MAKTARKLVRKATTKQKISFEARKTVLAILNNEHNNLLKLLRRIEFTYEEPFELDLSKMLLLYDVVRYFSEHWNSHHHQTEDLLYRKLLNRDKTYTPHLDQAIKDHARQEKTIRKLMSLLNTALRTNDLGKAADIKHRWQKYATTLRTHVIREEETVFPLLSEKLQEVDWEEARSLLLTGEDPLFQGKVQDDFRALYDYLEWVREGGQIEEGLNANSEVLAPFISIFDQTERNVADFCQVSMKCAGDLKTHAQEFMGSAFKISVGPRLYVMRQTCHALDIAHVLLNEVPELLGIGIKTQTDLVRGLARTAFGIFSLGSYAARRRQPGKNG